jgi:hypothetical protein
VVANHQVWNTIALVPVVPAADIKTLIISADLDPGARATLPAEIDDLQFGESVEKSGCQ